MLTRKNEIEDKICNQQFTYYDVNNKDLIYAIEWKLYAQIPNKSNTIQYCFSLNNPNTVMPQWNMFIATKWQEMISGHVGLLHGKSNANQSPSK